MPVCCVRTLVFAVILYWSLWGV